MHSLELDALDRYLRGRGFRLDPPTPLTYDPDGPGPLPAVLSDWRTVSFATSPITACDVFFIGYAKERLTPSQVQDRAAAREHPNGARAWTSVWLLSSDVGADRQAFPADVLC